MEKKSRFELIKIVEAQKEQLGRYETRLRDVVHAYRNLLQEKEALEASVTVLTSGNNQLFNKQSTNSSKREVSEPADQTDGSEDKNSTASKGEEQLQSPSQESKTWQEGVIDHPLALEQSDAGRESSSQHEEGKETSNQANIEELQQKIVTLSASLSTVMQQKSKMEASYQADKKKMMQHHEAKLNEYQEEKEKLEKNVQTLEEQLQELKLRMRHEQQAREEELNNNVLMLRELQMLVSTERSAKEDLEQQLEDAKEQAMVTKRSPSSKVEEYERQISQLQVELQGVQRRLKEAEKTTSQPSPLLVLLQEEMVKMKKEHADAVVREQKRANDAEERLRIITTLEECRVADLEVKLSELSEVVGNYEKLRLQDQQAIQKLKERLQQLDVENASLSRQISFDETLSPNNEKGMGEDESEEDLKQQVNKLKGLLRIALDSCDKPLELELERLSKSELESLIVSDPTHKVCQQELKQLKEEFERYKVKTQALHKNKSFKELSLQLEKLERLKTHNDELIRQVQELRDVSNEKEQDQGKVIANLRDKLKMMEENHKQEKEESNTIYKQKLEDLERQVLNQRERTLALVAEKDAEIEILRSRSPASSPSVQSGTAVPAFSYQRKFVELTAGSQAIFDSSQASEADTAVHQLLSKPSGATGSESSLVHYAQQQARREAESTAIRRHKNELEVALRDAEIREEKLCEQANVLKEEIRKLERDRSRESANLEYLKNIVLRFMMSTSYSVKQQMITAIATILQFSPKELNQVRKVQSATWWGT